MPPSRSITAIDLFSGCGGLTVGLKRAGFRVDYAVELDERACSTYKVNHPEVKALRQDVRTVFAAELPGFKSVDLVAGCPPCQGFSSLTSKNKKKDPRNGLVVEMARLVEELSPRIVMMENVPGLAQKGERLLGAFVNRLEAAGYMVEWDVLQIADYGVPQLRRRFVLLAGKGFRVAIPKPTHSRLGLAGLPRWRTVKDTIHGQPKPLRVDELDAAGGPLAVNWHVVRNLSTRNQQRLKHAVPGLGWTKIPKRLRPPCHQEKEAGFRNAYGRMEWNEPAPTITGGCVTLSKGRFGHPDQDRTISVREAALLQTFPSEYIFDCKYVEDVAAMIGNALPCDFAEIMASACAKALRVGSKTQR
jgi:DNA (cytosine-5)-methyltransferase 1